jgi:hypothetical protein
MAAIKSGVAPWLSVGFDLRVRRKQQFDYIGIAV